METQGKGARRERPMGEYAQYGLRRIKIGTCGNMYYLRADQRYEVYALSGNVDPARAADLAVIRFRFPFPDEDHVKPGEFDRYDRVIGLYGVAVPADVEHDQVQFVTQPGYLVSLPCPESAAGKTSGLTFHRNGHPGPVQFGQQALRDGKWVLIGRCGGCHASYRYATLADVEPVVVVLRQMADRKYEDETGRAFYHLVA